MGEHHRRRGKRRFDDDEPFAPRGQRRHLTDLTAFDTTDGLDEGESWSSWDRSTAGQRGPRPHPDWLVTELAAVDTELGVLKTGKEADVFLVRRAVPDTDRSCLLAAKRYRDPEHRMFHRDATYLEGRRVRESRDNRAMAARSTVGRRMIATQWAGAEFAALCQLYQAGLPVPYPAQILDTEILLEFVGDSDGTAAPRLADARPRGEGLAAIWERLVEAMLTLAELGFAHGDLSAYNVLVRDGAPVIIDLPQLTDVVTHPRGADLLARDAANVARWFAGRGLPATATDGLADRLLSAARLA